MSLQPGVSAQAFDYAGLFSDDLHVWTSRFRSKALDGQ